MELRFSIQITIELINDGYQGKIWNLGFRLVSNELWIIGKSQHASIQFLSKNYALRELELIKEEFFEICNSYPEFCMYFKDKVKIFHLVVDDSGKLSIKVCHDKDGIITWSEQLQ